MKRKSQKSVATAVRTERYAVASTFVAALALLAACGGSSPKVASDSAPSEGGEGNKQCKSKDNCPAVEMSFESSSRASDGAFVGYLDESNTSWRISGVDMSNSGRTVAILVNDYPKDSELNPDPREGGYGVQASLAVEFTPRKLGTSSTPMQIIMRDLDRCKIMESDQSVCNKFGLLSAYDKQESVQWRIEDRDSLDGTSGGGDDVVRVSDPNCGGQQATTDGEIVGKVLQTGIGIITGGAAAIPGIIMQGATGMLGGAGKADPTEC